jgi:type IV pilus assembly protein PilA
VIVIVGILSAVALPQFLNQTAKAKATEAKSQMSAMFKNGSASFTEGSIANAGEVCLTAPGPKTLFSYSCAGTLPVVVITATGNGTVDSSLTGKTLKGCVNLDTGLSKIDKELNAKTPTAAADCTETTQTQAPEPGA